MEAPGHGNSEPERLTNPQDTAIPMMGTRCTAAAAAAASPESKTGTKAQGKKRTRTGCRTCRKRRIKCGEERPACHNCSKSKRQCEGYNQRVVFKDPFSGYPKSVSHSAPIGYNQPSSGASYLREDVGRGSKPIAPKPFATVSPDHSPASHHVSSIVDEPSICTYSDLVPVHDRKDRSRTAMVRGHQVLQRGLQHNTLRCPARTASKEAKSPMTPPITSSDELPGGGEHSRSRASAQAQARVLGHHGSAQHPVSSHSSCPPPATSIGDEPLSPASTAPRTFGDPPVTVKTEDRFCAGYTEEEAIPSVCRASQQAMWQGSFDDQYTEDEEDPYDVSDYDISMGDYGDTTLWPDGDFIIHQDSSHLGVTVVARDNSLTLLPSSALYLNDQDALTGYLPPAQSMPLRDQMTTKIFCHFVNVVAPAISPYERCPANPSLMFKGLPVPRSQQHIWTYTFPTLAFQNTGLLHAMLAIGSYSMAKLQRGPITASLKHYAISLRRVGKALGSHSRRKEPATLAAAMLLAFYEVWSADHQKWSNHLLGAKYLVREIDFAGMARYIKRHRRQIREGQDMKMRPGFLWMERFLCDVDEIDENIVGMIMGRRVRYEEYGKVFEGTGHQDENIEYTEKDLDTYETQRDLFWWYCKQDVYQSFLGGGKLFLDYTFWSHCPPRAPLGRLDAIYGSYDHLILLMGRIGAFMSRDLQRKRLALKASGGKWTPPEHSRQTTAGAPSNRPFHQPPPMPTFSGMVPNIREAELPLGFETSRESPLHCNTFEDVDLNTQLQQALQEWEEIHSALLLLESYLGEDFQALGPAFLTPIETPFGPALQYRRRGIAGIWMNYHMAAILLQRSHPSMPPASMVAAGIAARQTATHANEIARIAAGIAPGCHDFNDVDPSIKADLIESSTSLFVAGVQFQCPSQRSYTVLQLRAIARLTGWQTANAILAGCETYWIKAGEMGKGPVYVRETEVESWKLPDLGGKERRIDRALNGKEPKERRLIIEKDDRVHYALGVLGMQVDFEGLDVGD